MSIEVTDIETYNEAFIVCSLNRDTLEKLQFEISFRKNNTHKLLSHLKQVKGQIGYNNLNFDYPILHWFINNYHKYDQHTLPKAICEKAQEIIQQEFSSISPKYVKIPQLDLFRIWHFDNKAKSTSLKQLEFVMRMPNIQDLPYGIYEHLTSDMIDKLIEYCHHDVWATYLFYQITIGNTDDPRFEELYNGKNKIEFRNEMSRKFHVNFINANDVKIGEEINKLTYLKLTGKTWYEIRNLRTKRGLINVRQLIPNYISFINQPLKDLYAYIYDKQINCYNPKLEYKFKFAGNKWKFALGGIHTEDSGRMVIPNKDQLFEEKDVSSMYPNKIIETDHPYFHTKGLYPAHLGIEWLVGYKSNKNTRLGIKALTNKTTSQTQEVEVLKLSLNGGGYGKTGEETNWQYDPLVKYTTTIQCQLDILLLADMLWNTTVVQIESGNTDGINILYNKEYTKLIETVCKNWERITNAQLETTEYSKLIRTSVNDYMAIKSSGKIKRKGDFEIDKEMHKNHSQRIVYIAIDKYYLENIRPEDTIKNHTDLFDFCKVAKAIGKAKYIDRSWSKDQNKFVFDKLQKVNRYIVTNDGTKLIKLLPQLEHEDGTLKKDKIANYRKENPLQIDMFHSVNDPIVIKDRESEVEAGYQTEILNTILSTDIADYNLNYKYYIDQCYRIINQINK